MTLTVDPQSGTRATADRAARVTGLLEVALAAFARAGLHGARVDAIARSAGMNKRLLYHYVGDKEALFDAALELALARVLERPGHPLTNEWRLICHGVAERRAGLDGHLADIARAAAGPRALAITLLASLLPSLADELLKAEEVLEAEETTGRDRAEARERAAGRLGGTGVPVKPRLKLRPALTRAGPARKP